MDIEMETALANDIAFMNQWKLQNRFESLKNIGMGEFVVVKLQILKAFNDRTGLNILRFNDIETDLVVDEDTKILKDHFDSLMSTLLSREANIRCMKCVLNARNIMTDHDIMKYILNMLIYKSKGILKENLSIQDLDEILDYKPTLEEIQVTGLTIEESQKAMTQYFKSN
jgi:hypothetical protein